MNAPGRAREYSAPFGSVTPHRPGMLYICTVYCEVFRTRWQGEKLSDAERVKHTRKVGELVFTERIWDPRPDRSIFVAMLLRPDGETYVIPLLDQARVRKVKNGILISGRETVPRGIGMKNIKADCYPQTWWCVPIVKNRVAFDDFDPEGQVDPEKVQLASELEGQRVGALLQRRPTRRGRYDPDQGTTVTPNSYF